MKRTFACSFLVFLTTAACGTTAAVPADPDAGPLDGALLEPPVDAGGGAPDAGTSDAGFLGDASAPFVLTSAAFADGGTLDARFTCDGAGVSPPLTWTAPPAGTAELALLATTEARDGRKWNWVVYRLPPTARGIPEGGPLPAGAIAGLTSDGPNLAYSPPCSQGPGAKSYTFTVYALATAPTLPSDPRQVTGAVLEAAIAGAILAPSALSASYTR